VDCGLESGSAGGGASGGATDATAVDIAKVLEYRCSDSSYGFQSQDISSSSVKRTRRHSRFEDRLRSFTFRVSVQSRWDGKGLWKMGLLGRRMDCCRHCALDEG
jgi:hypothetical protein